MTLAPPFAVSRAARLPVERRSEDRWLLQPRRSDRDMWRVAVVAGSIGLHGLFVAVVLVAGAPSAPPLIKEIEVEIIRDLPKPSPARLADPPPRLAAPVPEANSKPPADAQEFAALQKELAGLKAEHAALETAQQAAASGPGKLADGVEATALPTIAGDGGDGIAATYQELVFSQLAKAKGIGQRQGRKGSAGVHFKIDAQGGLEGVELVSPSGDPTLDQEALDIVRQAAPFPKPGKDDQRDFVANVNFTPQSKL